jgi:hypothetical protein
MSRRAHAGESKVTTKSRNVGVGDPTQQFCDPSLATGRFKGLTNHFRCGVDALPPPAIGLNNKWACDGHEMVYQSFWRDRGIHIIGPRYPFYSWTQPG